MFDFLTGRKKQGPNFKPQQEVTKLVELSPPSALLFLADNKSKDLNEALGKAFFLRKEKKLYTENSHLYLTTPDNLKIAKDQNLTSQHVSLQFMNKRIPYRLDCKIVGRFRLRPEVVDTLDFNAKSAYKLIPTKHVKETGSKAVFPLYTEKLRRFSHSLNDPYRLRPIYSQNGSNISHRRCPTSHIKRYRSH